MPYTTACPYMPGQTVNTLQVPIERTARVRSASMNSVHLENFRTMDPATKFMKPLPPTPLSPGTNKQRSQSAPQPSSSSCRSTSPRSWRRFFSRKTETSNSQHAVPAGSQETTFTAYDNVITVSPPHARSGRHVSSLSDGARPRDISPSSLSRMLREERRVPRFPSHAAQLSPLKIPEDVIENDEEDEDFAASAISESLPFTTVLSPPPFQRSSSSDTIKRNTEAGSSSTPVAKPSLSISTPFLNQNQPISAVINETRSGYEWPVTRTDRITRSPLQEDVPMSFYDDDEDDDDVLSSNEDEGPFFPAPISPSLLSSFEGYSLPPHVEGNKDAFLRQTLAYRGSPKLIPDRSNLLNTPVEAGLDDFVSELRWIAGAISTREWHR